MEEAVQKSIVAFNERRDDLARKVVEDDEIIDQREVEIEENCLKVLALHQPVAQDLRFIAAVMKINNDLERIADYAVAIAERTSHLVKDTPIRIPNGLSEMAELARRMVRDALDAFVKGDVQLARGICARDDQVDGHNRTIIKELRRMMHETPDMIDQALDVFSTTRRLERIADMATNIAQDVVYMVEGEIIRHRPQTESR